MGLMDIIQQRLNNMDEEEAQQMLDQVDIGQVHQGIENLFAAKVAPHLYAVRDAYHNEYDDNEEVREELKGLPEDRQEELFFQTLKEMAAVLEGLREKPQAATPKLKSMLRDPYTLEALLLIYENEHIDEEYRDQLKEFTAGWLHIFGVMLAPEMYTKQEIRQVMEDHGLEGYL